MGLFFFFFFGKPEVCAQPCCKFVGLTGLVVAILACHASCLVLAMSDLKSVVLACMLPVIYSLACHASGLLLACHTSSVALACLVCGFGMP